MLFVVLESQPLVVTNSSEQVNQAESVKQLMQQLRNSVRNRTYKQTIYVNEAQANSLIGFAQRANPKISGKINISQDSSSVLVSFQLPKNPIGNYFNIDILMLSGAGINISHVKLGSMNVPGDFALDTLEYIANWYTDSTIATQFVQQVESVSMTKGHMQLSVLPLDTFLQGLNDIKQGVGGIKDEEMRLRTAYYLKKLSELKVGKLLTSQSLASYIGPIFDIAKSRSSYETAPKENEAAIIALAIYAGHHRFANLVGDVQPIKGRAALPNSKTLLHSRADLSQHFIFSAAIKILSEKGLSIAIGEFKELMDRSNDGSGFSFVDLAADFAGVEFAVTATNIETASDTQQILAGNNDEQLFFPDVIALPEGLSKKEFTNRFSKVDSPAYLNMLQEINSRIATLPIHQTLAN